MTARRQRAERRGRWAETFAACVLIVKGYRILARRYRTPVGEIDIVARRGRTLAMVEVKLRQSLASGAEAVGPVQQQRITRAASFFMARRSDCHDCDTRFDVMLLAPWRLPRHLAGGWWAT